MKWKAKPLICFWLNYVVFLSSVRKTVAINGDDSYNDVIAMMNMMTMVVVVTDDAKDGRY